MPKYVGVITLLLCLVFLVIGCSQAGETNLPEESEEIAAPTDIQMTPTETAAPTPKPTQTLPEPTVEEKQADWVLSTDAGQYLGEVKTVRVELAHCAYKPGINGTPTFCNDQPYPNHVFTFLVWGKDWSNFDQTCALVTGEISEYDGKIQIVLDEEEQIVPCDD